MGSPSERLGRLALAVSALCVLVASSPARASTAATGSPIVAGERKISNLSGDPGVALATGDLFGSGVATIGDVDGDGIPDVAVGARGTTGPLPGGAGEGAVWVLLMNHDGTVKASVKISTALPALSGLLHTDDNFGRSVAGIGDVDGNGVPDIAVGAPNDDTHDADDNQIDDGDGINRGAVYILLMGPGVNVIGVRKISDLDPALTIPNNTDQFGSSIAALGDLGNLGPGHFALAVGAKGDRDGDALPSFLRGAVYVLFMHVSGGMPIDAVQKISDTQGTPVSLHLHNSDLFGSSLASIGDFNSDGTTDLAVGAPDDDDNNDGDASIGANRGAVYVMLLSTGGVVTEFQKISEITGGFTGSLDASDFFGDGVEKLPDLDSNGVTDLVVGSSGDDDGNSGAGAAYVLLMDYDSGSHAIGVHRNLKISLTAGGFGGSLAVDDALGSSVTNVGDLDGDGLPDLMVGAPGTDDGAGSAGATHVVRLGRSTTTLAQTPIPAHCGDALTVTAAVSPSSATGTVELFEGVTSLGTAPLAGGTASFPLAPRPVGSYTLHAVYGGDGADLNSASPDFSLDVSLAPTSVTVTSSGTPAVFGVKVDLTAHVTPSGATGTVHFFDGADPLGTAPVAAGDATISTSSLTVGSHSITATYDGDACNAASDPSQPFAQLIDPITTTTTLLSDPPTSHCGDKVTLTATVDPAAATGTVEFFDGATSLGTSPLVGGSAVISVTGFGGGTHDLTASYAGDATHAASSSQTLGHVVTPAGSSLLLASDVNPAKFAVKVTFTATVTPPTATGSVEFLDGAASMGTTLLAGGQATLSVTTLGVGPHSITAQYSGDACNDPSVSPPLTQEIVPDNPPQVTVLSPNGGEELNIGTDATLSWTATDDNSVASVTLEISRDLGATWVPIATDIANTGTYTWPVSLPGTNINGKPGFTALFRVTAQDNGGQPGNDVSDAPFAIVDLSTAVVVTRLDAESTDQGIAVHWALQGTSPFSSVTLERSEIETGPWNSVGVQTLQDGAMLTLLDRSVEAGRVYWYRLHAVTSAGALATFGPVKGEAAAVTAFAFSRLAPNPTRGPLSVEFAVANEARVVLDLLDLQGRVVSTLADATYRPGRYLARWDGVGSKGEVAPGLYFVRCQMGGKTFSQRVVIAR